MVVSAWTLFPIGCSRTTTPLSDFYPQLIENHPKLEKLQTILSKTGYKVVPTLITSSFPEMTLVIELVSQVASHCGVVCATCMKIVS